MKFIFIYPQILFSLFYLKMCVIHLIDLTITFSFFYSSVDYAVAVFHEGLLNKRYECYLEPHTRLPMIYIEDCLLALFQFLNTPEKLLRRRVYNVTAMSFTPEELFNELFKYIPDLKITYKPDKRQHIGMYVR